VPACVAPARTVRQEVGGTGRNHGCGCRENLQIKGRGNTENCEHAESYAQMRSPQPSFIVLVFLSPQTTELIVMQDMRRGGGADPNKTGFSLVLTAPWGMGRNITSDQSRLACGEGSSLVNRWPDLISRAASLAPAFMVQPHRPGTRR